jgi:cell division protein ZipA
MSELRWTLLILGAVFIAVLSWWERRRPRQAFAPRLRDSEPLGAERLERMSPPAGLAAGNGASTAQAREPWIGDTDLAETVVSDVALRDAADTGEPRGEDPDSERADPERTAPGPLEKLPTLIIPDEEDQVALKAAWDEGPPEPTLIDPEASADAGQLAPPPVQVAEVVDVVEEAAPPPMEADPLDREIPGAEGVGSVRIVDLGAGVAHAEPIVDWPPEESRRILALRLIAPHPERFPGRALRLALAAEGFRLGKFSIYHKTDEADRAVLSAASLTRPGAFDLESMDLQRYAGLSLFAVLPGPKTPRQAFEELLATARNLNERLQGQLQDERGGPLTPLRVASIRDSLKADAGSPPAAAAHEA